MLGDVKSRLLFGEVIILIKTVILEILAALHPQPRGDVEGVNDDQDPHHQVDLSAQELQVQDVATDKNERSLPVLHPESLVQEPALLRALEEDLFPLLKVPVCVFDPPEVELVCHADGIESDRNKVVMREGQQVVELVEPANAIDHDLHQLGETGRGRDLVHQVGAIDVADELVPSEEDHDDDLRFKKQQVMGVHHDKLLLDALDLECFSRIIVLRVDADPFDAVFLRQRFVFVDIWVFGKWLEKLIEDWDARQSPVGSLHCELVVDVVLGEPFLGELVQGL